MVSTNDVFHSPIFSFGVLVNAALSGVWEEASDGGATARMTKCKAWLKRITFYKILVGMTATLKHLFHYRPVTLQ